MRVAVYMIGGTARTRHVGVAMAEGLARCGVHVTVEERWRGVMADVAIAYGWNHEPVFSAYRDAGNQFVYWDMGYWDRRPPENKKDGYHRLAVNGWDTADTMLRCMPGDRFARANIQLKPWGSKGRMIVLAGMSGKAAGTHGFKLGQWERTTFAQLQTVTDRPIYIRAKPTGDQAKIEPIADLLSRCHMLITHHSNAAMDALIAGIPFHARKGVGKILAPQSAPLPIEDYPAISDNERLQLMQDIAYAQWRPSEMRTGEAWEHIKCILHST
jgi:hypothetical protein